MHYINAHGREDFTFSPPTLGDNNKTRSECQESTKPGSPWSSEQGIL